MTMRLDANTNSSFDKPESCTLSSSISTSSPLLNESHFVNNESIELIAIGKQILSKVEVTVYGRMHHF
jgi:hypothetical protein